jgi:hypothetical protein
MRKVFILAVIVAALFASCQKDDTTEEVKALEKIEQVSVVNDGREAQIEDEKGSRAGNFYPLFYKESLTTDNWTTNDSLNIQRAFSKKQTDSVFLVRVPNTNRIKINGVWHLYYDAKLKLVTGDTIKLNTVWSVEAGNVVKYKPFGAYVVEAQATEISLTRTKTTKTFGNWYRGTNEVKFIYNIKADGVLLESDAINGNNGSIFVLPHK